MYATTKNLVKVDQDKVREAVLGRFSPVDGVGVDIKNASTYEEALKLSGLGFTPLEEKLVTESTGRVITGYKALFNSITQRQLSVVKNEYTVISNEEAFSTAEDLVAYEGFKYEVSNMKRDGARSRLILSGPNVYIAGEEYTPYAIFNNSFDTTKSVCIQFMFLRLACLNGLMRKAPSCNSTLALSHFGQKEAKLKRLTEFRNTFAITLNYLQREAAVLQSIPLSREEFRNELAPLAASHVLQRKPNTPLTEQQQAKNEAYIMAAMKAYDAIDTTNFDGTAFKAQLAFADVDSHLAPFMNRGRPDIYLDRILQSDTVLSAANVITNYIIESRNVRI